MTNKILSELSCNQEVFNKGKPCYEEVLSESNYKASLQFEKLQDNTKKIDCAKCFFLSNDYTFYKQLRQTKI